MTKIGFEEALRKLENIVEQLESLELDLDESLKLFEEGVRLSVYCNNELEQADTKINKLIKNLEGELELQEFE